MQHLDLFGALQKGSLLKAACGLLGFMHNQVGFIKENCTWKVMRVERKPYVVV